MIGFILSFRNLQFIYIQLHYDKHCQPLYLVDKMTKYNKLTSLVLFSLVSQLGHTLSFDSANVQSGQGQLLYVEIPYRNASANQPLQASLASGGDLIGAGSIPNADDNLNIFVRRTSANNGVIVITSDRPITANQLNVALKVQDGDGTYIQQVKKALPSPTSKTTVAMSTQEKALVPQIVTEKEISLNLPTSTLYTNPAAAPNHTTTPDQPLAIQVSAPPALQRSNQSQQQITPAPSVTSSVTPHPVISPPVRDIAPVHHAAITPKNSPPVAKAQSTKTPSDAKQKPIPQPHLATTNTATHYTVQRQDSLWTIASRIAAETHQSVPAVMRQIKALNEHAFIAGNVNRLKQGASLNLNLHPTASQAKVLPHQTPSTAAKTKYRLDQAEMSLIADNPNKVSSDATQQTKQRSTTNALSSKLLATRQKTLSLQKQVSQLDFALQQKDHKLEILNARLAQLQQQLQQRQTAKKQQHH